MAVLNLYVLSKNTRFQLTPPIQPDILESMNTDIFSQAFGFLACAGVLVVIALVAIVSLSIGWRRGRKAASLNPVIQPPNTPPYENGDFIGVPATGPAQADERNYPSENMIGSSGFGAQRNEPLDDPGQDKES